MKKLFTFFAISAIVLGMVSCGGENGTEPEVKVPEFQYSIEALPKKAHIVVRANEQNAFFYSSTFALSEIKAQEDLKQFLYGKIQGYKFADLKNFSIVRNTCEYTSKNLEPGRQYAVIACYVEEENERINIIGDIEYKEFTTMPEETLNGEFTVSKDGKKVHFAQGNLRQDVEGGEYFINENQWQALANLNGYPSDYHLWETTQDFSPNGPWFVLTGDEWWYLFRERENAEVLFAHATVNGTKGLIILPDNWQKPIGSQLTLDKSMTFTWNPNQLRYSSSYINDGSYDKNTYNVNEWEVLEFAGAVFLPDPWYWTSSDSGDKAYSFSFAGNYVDLETLQEHAIDKTNRWHIRPAREVK